MLGTLTNHGRAIFRRSAVSAGQLRLCRVLGDTGSLVANGKHKLASVNELSSDSEAASPSKQTIESHLGPISSAPTIPESRPVVIIISGPSGVGKDAVIKSLRQARPDLAFVVTATSRPKRPGEVEGKDYFFVSKQQFKEWLQNGELLEHANVYGDYKGIPRSQVERALQRGSDVVLRIDVQGAATIRRLMPDALCIFLVAESETKLVERLVSRKTEPLSNLLLRIQTARKELTSLKDFDYVVVNREGGLSDTVTSISGIIEAEKLRVARRRHD